jgi:hypothetical protein
MLSTWQNRSTQRKPCPSATLSTINLTWTGPGSNTGLRGDRPTANRPSPMGTACNEPCASHLDLVVNHSSRLDVKSLSELTNRFLCSSLWPSAVCPQA